MPTQCPHCHKVLKGGRSSIRNHIRQKCTEVPKFKKGPRIANPLPSDVVAQVSTSAIHTSIVDVSTPSHNNQSQIPPVSSALPTLPKHEYIC